MNENNLSDIKDTEPRSLYDREFKVWSKTPNDQDCKGYRKKKLLCPICGIVISTKNHRCEYCGSFIESE